MKKTLLFLIAALAVSMSANAQKSWNFSNTPFGAAPTVVFTSTFVVDGLTVGTDGSALFSLDANGKSLDGFSFTHRLKSGGGGAPAAGSFIPTTRYLSMNVSGPSTIELYMMSSSSSASRVMYISNADQSKVDSIVDIIGTAIAKYTFDYTGSASTLYFYSKSSGINFYLVTATNVLTSVNNVLTGSLKFDGNVISNPEHLSLEVFNVVGKKVAVSTKDINVGKYERGVYFVRAEGIKGAMKFKI